MPTPLKKQRLYLATLFIDRGAHPEYDVSLAETVHAGLFDLDICRIGYGDNSLRQLNRRAAHFLASGADYFWLQGNDTDWKPQYIARMAASGKPIIGGRFPVKQAQTRWCYNVAPGGTLDLMTDLIEVQHAGLESLLIHRDVFLKWQAARPQDMYHSQFSDQAVPGGDHDIDRPEWNFWQWDIREDPATGKRRFLSEDYFFCHTARELGFKVFVDCSDYCGHWDHRTRYPLRSAPPA